jgi:hypothetical protein
MITAIILISLAFAWLGFETKWFTVRLLVGESLEDDYLDPSEDNKRLIRSLNDGDDVDDNPNPPIRKPITFTPLDMPEIQGTINIGYKRI